MTQHVGIGTDLADGTWEKLKALAEAALLPVHDYVARVLDYHVATREEGAPATLPAAEPGAAEISPANEPDPSARPLYLTLDAGGEGSASTTPPEATPAPAPDKDGAFYLSSGPASPPREVQ